MINGKQYLTKEAKQKLRAELEEMRQAFVEECHWAKEFFPEAMGFSYLGTQMSVTSLEFQNPRPVKAFSLEDATEMYAAKNYTDIFEIPDVRGAHNAEGKVTVNCEYLNSVTGRFQKKAFNIDQLRKIVDLPLDNTGWLLFSE